MLLEIIMADKQANCQVIMSYIAQCNMNQHDKTLFV